MAWMGCISGDYKTFLREALLGAAVSLYSWGEFALLVLQLLL
jgi:hypothetical protein